MRYRTGEEVQVGDRVNYEGILMSVEHVVEGLTGDPYQDWLFTNHGAGIMFLDSKLFGRMYLGDDPEEHDRVVFLGRRDEKR